MNRKIIFAFHPVENNEGRQGRKNTNGNDGNIYAKPISNIGSNDLTQLTLGLDRDSDIVSHLFDEKNEAVTILIAQAITAAKNAGINIGLCGQAPSNFPEFSQFLVEQGIDSISFTPDALNKGIENIAKAELVMSTTLAEIAANGEKRTKIKAAEGIEQSKLLINVSDDEVLNW